MEQGMVGKYVACGAKVGCFLLPLNLDIQPLSSLCELV